MFFACGEAWIKITRDRKQFRGMSCRNDWNKSDSSGALELAFVYFSPQSAFLLVVEVGMAQQMCHPDTHQPTLNQQACQESRNYIQDSTSKSSCFSQQVGSMWKLMPTKIAAANSLHRFAEYDLPTKDHKFKKCNSLNFILACEPMLKERSFFALFRTVSRNSAASCLLNHYLHFPRTCNCSQVSFLFLKIITHCSRWTWLWPDLFNWILLWRL